MRRKTRKALKLSAEHAAIALNLLIQDGKIAATDVAKALKNREKMIKDLRSRLIALEEAAAPVARRLAADGRKAYLRARPKVKKAISRAQRVARQAQGRYMAAVRSLSKDARAKIRTIRAALKMAK